MNFRKYIESECKYYIFILSVIYVLQYLLYRTCMWLYASVNLTYEFN